MEARWINNPYPVWNEIRSYLSDDTGELETKGRFIGVFDCKDMAGAFLVKPWNQYCCELHGGVAPAYWGKGAEICDLAGRAVFYGTPCLKLVAAIPSFNRLMRKTVQDLGMKQEGIVTKAYLKWSKLHDLYLYGMTKMELRERQK